MQLDVHRIFPCSQWPSSTDISCTAGTGTLYTSNFTLSSFIPVFVLWVPLLKDTSVIPSPSIPIYHSSAPDTQRLCLTQPLLPSPVLLVSLKTPLNANGKVQVTTYFFLWLKHTVTLPFAWWSLHFCHPVPWFTLLLIHLCSLFCISLRSVPKVESMWATCAKGTVVYRNVVCA